MRITQIGRRSRRIKFTQPGEGVRFIAGMNESHGNYESAAKLYRDIGDEESAKRCEGMMRPAQPERGQGEDRM